jgi:hypothetical protein
VFSNLLPGSDSFVATVVTETSVYLAIAHNGLLALAPLFRLSAVTSQYLYHIYSAIKYKYIGVTDERNALAVDHEGRPDHHLHNINAHNKSL